MRTPPGLWARMVRHRADYLYVAPAVLVMALVIAYPVWFTFYLSVFATPPNLALEDKIFVGLDNYGRILAADSVREASLNTLVWTVASTGCAFVLGFGAALALNRPFRGRGLLRGTLLIPYVISAVAAAYVWRWLLHSDLGVLSALAMASGLRSTPFNFLDNTDTVLASVIMVNVWKEFPFVMIMMLAGLQTVPDQLLRAAQVDGAGASEIWITQIYQLAFGRIRFGLASAYSVILFVVMMTMGYFYVRALVGKDRAP